MVPQRYSQVEQQWGSGLTRCTCCAPQEPPLHHVTFGKGLSLRCGHPDAGPGVALGAQSLSTPSALAPDEFRTNTTFIEEIQQMILTGCSIFDLCTCSEKGMEKQGSQEERERMFMKWIRAWGILAVVLLVAPLVVLAQQGRRGDQGDRGDIQVTNDWDNTVTVTLWKQRGEQISRRSWTIRPGHLSSWVMREADPSVCEATIRSRLARIGAGLISSRSVSCRVAYGM